MKGLRKLPAVNETVQDALGGSAVVASKADPVEILSST